MLAVIEGGKGQINKPKEHRRIKVATENKVKTARTSDSLSKKSSYREGLRTFSVMARTLHMRHFHEENTFNCWVILVSKNHSRW